MLLHRARDIHKCIKSIGSFTDQQASVVSWDSDHLEWITIQIFPKGGPYAGAKYNFMIKFDKQYPKQPPQVDCITPIYHPNIDMTGEDYNVCLSLFDEWVPSFGLEDIIQGLLFLLYYPNLEDPLSPWFDPSMDAEEFAQNLNKSLKGEFIEDAFDFVFPKMIEPEIDKVPGTVECTKPDEVTDLGVCDEEMCGLPEVIVMESDVKSNNVSIGISEKCSSSEENGNNIEKVTQKENDASTENAVDTEENKKPGPGSLAGTEINSSDSEVKTPEETFCNHSEMVTILEDNFLTGFAELMSMDLFSDVDDNLSEYSEEYIGGYDEDDERTDCMESDAMSDSDSYLSCKTDTIVPSASWKDKMYGLLRSVIDYVSDSDGVISDVSPLHDLYAVANRLNIQTCVDTGHTYCEDEDLAGVELYLSLLMRNHSPEAEDARGLHISSLFQSQSSDEGSVSSGDTESCCLDTCDTPGSVFTDTSDRTLYSECDRQMGRTALRDAAIFVGYYILAKLAANHRLFRGVPVWVFHYLWCKTVS